MGSIFGDSVYGGPPAPPPVPATPSEPGSTALPARTPALQKQAPQPNQGIVPRIFGSHSSTVSAPAQVTDDGDIQLIEEARRDKILNGAADDLGDHQITIEEWRARGLPDALFKAFAGPDGVMDEKDFVALMQTIRLFAFLFNMTEKQAINVYMAAKSFTFQDVVALQKKKVEVKGKMDAAAASQTSPTSVWENFKTSMKICGYTSNDLSDEMQAFYDDYKTKNGKEPTFDELFDHLFNCFMAARYYDDIQKNAFGMKKGFIRYSSGEASDVEPWLKNEVPTSRGLRIEAAAVAAYDRLVKEFRDLYGFELDRIGPEDVNSPELRAFMKELSTLAFMFKSYHMQSKIQEAYVRVISVATRLDPSSKQGIITNPAEFAAMSLLVADPATLQNTTQWVENYIDFAKKSPYIARLDVFVFAYNYYNGVLYNLLTLAQNAATEEQRQAYLQKADEISKKLAEVTAQLQEVNADVAVQARKNNALGKALSQAIGVSLEDMGSYIVSKEQIPGLAQKLQIKTPEQAALIGNLADRYYNYAMQAGMDPQSQREAAVFAFNYNNALICNLQRKARLAQTDEERQAYQAQIDELIEKQKALIEKLSASDNEELSDVVNQARFTLAMIVLDNVSLCGTEEEQNVYIAKAFEIIGATADSDKFLVDGQNVVLVYLRAAQVLWESGRADEAVGLLSNGLNVDEGATLPTKEFKLKINGKVVKVKLGKGEVKVSGGISFAGQEIKALPDLNDPKQFKWTDSEKRDQASKMLEQLQRDAGHKRKLTASELKAKRYRKEAEENLSYQSGSADNLAMRTIASLRQQTFLPLDEKGKGKKGGAGRGKKNGSKIIP